MTITNYKNFAVLLLLFCILAPAHAHKVNLFAFVEGDKVYVEGYFADGKRALNSAVTVFDASGNTIAEGQTNDQGQYEFTVDQPRAVRILINAGMGHQAEYELPADDFSSLSATVTSIQNSVEKQEDSTSSITSSDINQQELNAIVEKAVAKAMRPMMRTLSEMREEKSLSEIVGGIGFIFGLMGIYFYLKARKNAESKA